MRFRWARLALCAVASFSGIVGAIKSRARADEGGDGSFSYAIVIGGDGRAAIRTTTLIPPEVMPQIACELGGLVARPRASAAAHSDQQMSWADGGCLVQTEDDFDSTSQLDSYLQQAGAGSVKMEGCSYALSLTLRFDAANPARNAQVEVIMPGLKSQTAGAVAGDAGPNSLIWASDAAPGSVITISANGVPDQCLWAVAWKNSPGHKIGHAFVIFEKSGKREAWGFYSSDVQLADYPRFYFFEDSFHGEIRAEETLFPQFEKKMQGEAANGLFAFRVFGVSRDQFDKAHAVLKRWQDKTVNHPYSINCMCGTFVQSVFSAAGIPIGGSNPEDNRPTALYDLFSR